MSGMLPTVAELHQDLPGIWLNDPALPDNLTFKLFRLCKKMYLVENEAVAEPIALHALGYIALILFHLTTDNGFHPNKDLPGWCKSALEAILKSSVWCWLELIADTSPINDNFANVITNMGCLEKLAAAHTAKLLKHALMTFGSTVAESGNGSIVLKHAMLVDTNEPVPLMTNEGEAEEMTVKSDASAEKHENDIANVDSMVIHYHQRPALTKEGSDIVQPPEWSLQNWPFNKVDNALCEEIINEGHWDVQPLVAYTLDEKLINLGDYKKEFAGAVVVMSFHLKYALPWNMMTKKKDKVQCTMEIVQIHVVTKLAPDLQFNSPSKRATPPRPKFGLPSKKQAL